MTRCTRKELDSWAVVNSGFAQHVMSDNLEWFAEIGEKGMHEKTQGGLTRADYDWGDLVATNIVRGDVVFWREQVWDVLGVDHRHIRKGVKCVHVRMKPVGHEGDWNRREMYPELSQVVRCAIRSEKPEPCGCGSGEWKHRLETIRGAVASDGSGRLPAMRAESWHCSGCSVVNHPGAANDRPENP